MTTPWDLDIAAASRALHARELGAEDLVRACLERIEALDGRVRAWVRVAGGRALAEARALDDELRDGRARGPLHGVPIAVKDIFYTEGLETEAGSELLEGFVPDRDAAAVARLRRAGAIVLGKTTTSELAMMAPTETANPWDLECTPGGSSAGSAAAVAARMCPGALGSQTGGSTGRPAAYCGVVGLKPSYGRISVDGVIPVSFSLDHVGLLTRSVLDAALLLQAVAGPDPADPLCSERPVPDYAGGLERRAARPPVLGLVRAYFLERADPEMRRTTEVAADVLRTAGAEVRPVELPASFEGVHGHFTTLLTAEAAAVHADRFGEGLDRYRPETRALIERGRALDAARYARARRHQIGFRRDALEMFRTADVLLTPGTPSTAPRDRTTTGPPSFQVPWSYAGLPSVALPAVVTGAGLPAGIQLVGRPFGEADLLGAARWCEDRLGFDAAPRCE